MLKPKQEDCAILDIDAIPRNEFILYTEMLAPEAVQTATTAKTIDIDVFGQLAATVFQHWLHWPEIIKMQ